MALAIIFYVIFPYIAITMAVIGWVYRFGYDKYSVSSQSSQFMGDKGNFLLGSYLWHYSIIAILFMHGFAILFPDYFNMVVTAENRDMWEYAGWAVTSLGLIGLVLLIMRRIQNERVLSVTTVLDWVVLLSLTIQVSFGLIIAIKYAPGSSWFISTMTPWIQSLFYGNPDYAAVANYAGLGSLQRDLFDVIILNTHFVNGMVLIALIPFSRLGHLIVYPIGYVMRKHQVVIWNKKKTTNN